MDDPLLGYYQSELSYLRELGAEFAAHYPKVAGRLKIEPNRFEDPHVDRLIEAFAFLTARIRKKLDDEFPEITEAFLNLVYPHYLRPLPSMAIVELVAGPEPGKLVDGAAVPAGSRLETAPVGGVKCAFRTVYPVTLWPVKVAEARLFPDRVAVAHKPAEAVALLQINLASAPGLGVGQLKHDRLRFYLEGEPLVTHSVYELLFNHVCRVVLQGRLADGTTETITLPPDAIQPVGYDRDEGMFPYPEQSFPGYRLLQEYFQFPEKFLFFELACLDRLAGRAWGNEVQVQFFLDRSPKAGIAVDAGTFRLNCTPAVNLFRRTCDPIVLDRTRFEYRVVPDGQALRAFEVYAVEEVTSAGGFLATTSHLEPLYKLRHPDGETAETTFWYASRRLAMAPEESGTEVYLSFVDPDFRPTRPSAEVLSVRALCTNGDLPSRLPFDAATALFTLEAAGPVQAVRCLRRPTGTYRVPPGRGLHGRLLSHLALNHLSLTGGSQAVETFRELLRLYDWQDSEATRKQIQGITAVRSRRAVGRAGRNGGVCQGVEVALEFDDGAFVGSGFFLLASVLERFLGAYVSINAFTQMVAQVRHREGVVKRWPPRAGYRTLL